MLSEACAWHACTYKLSSECASLQQRKVDGVRATRLGRRARNYSRARGEAPRRLAAPTLGELQGAEWQGVRSGKVCGVVKRMVVRSRAAFCQERSACSVGTCQWLHDAAKGHRRPRSRATHRCRCKSDGVPRGLQRRTEVHCTPDVRTSIAVHACAQCLEQRSG